MIKNTYPGKFIVFEGLDGSGQSTQASLLRDFLLKQGYQVILTKEPTKDSEAGRKIRQILDEKTSEDPANLQKLFAEDRKEHLQNIIIPALEQGKFVISDRYFYSSFAFGASDGVNLDWLIKLNDNFLLPDITFILRVTPRVCVERIDKRGTTKTLFEKEEKLTKVWKTYKILPERVANTMMIDGERSIETIHEEIKNIVSTKIFKNLSTKSQS